MTDRARQVYALEPTNPDGTPRKVVGMHRPLWPPFEASGYIQCTCGSILQSREGFRDHWQCGHFDSPLYEASE